MTEGEMTDVTILCHAAECTRHIPLDSVFCHRHLAMLSPAMGDRVTTERSYVVAGLANSFDYWLDRCLVTVRGR